MYVTILDFMLTPFYLFLEFEDLDCGLRFFHPAAGDARVTLKKEQTNSLSPFGT